MDTAIFLSLALACAPHVHIETAQALVAIESSFNPWAIGVVGARLERQPGNEAEAVATARALQEGGWNFSVGLAQINVGNLARLSLTLEEGFDPCRNLTAMQSVLLSCFDRARAADRASTSQTSLRQALSCYYSGNFVTGQREGYVNRIARVVATQRRSDLPRNVK